MRLHSCSAINLLHGAGGLTLALACAYLCADAAPSNEYLMYFGTYTGFKYMHHGNPTGESHSRGIYVSRFRPATGEITAPQLAAEIVNPSFLAIHPNQRYLYAVTEDPKSLGPLRDHASYVSAFAIEPESGQLRLLNTVPTGGTSTCYLSLDKAGKFVLLANYGSGSISVLRVHADGSLGELTAFIQHVGHGVDPSYQSAPHPHSIDVSPDNHFAVASDLGLDKVFIYRFDASRGALSPPDAPFVSAYPGGGPRHFRFDHQGRFGYLLSEMSGIVNVLAWDPSRGVLSDVQDAHSIPHDFHGENHSAEIQIHPNGRFLYESNRRRRGEDQRGPDTIGVFAIDHDKGTLSEVEEVNTGGIMPRHFAIDPSGAYLFVEHEWTNNVVVFRIDSLTGRLSPTGKTVTIDTPVCLKFVPLQH